MTTVRQATIELLRTQDLTTWFGNPGSSELTLLQEFPDDFRYFLGLQEMIPVGMADGFAQISRRPAIVNLHTAPGLGNAMGALYNAAWNKTPLVITAGNQRRNMQNQVCLLTNVDATLVPRPFVKWSAEPAIASEVPAVLARAIHVAQTPPMGPVFVSLPMDDMAVELGDTQLADIDVIRTRAVTRATGFPADTAQAIATRLAAAQPPAFIADVRSAAEALLDHVVPSDRPTPPARPETGAPEKATAPLEPSTLFALLNRAAPADTLWVTESGSSETVIGHQIRSGAPFSH